MRLFEDLAVVGAEVMQRLFFREQKNKVTVRDLNTAARSVAGAGCSFLLPVEKPSPGSAEMSESCLLAQNTTTSARAVA